MTMMSDEDENGATRPRPKPMVKIDDLDKLIARTLGEGAIGLAREAIAVFAERVTELEEHRTHVVAHNNELLERARVAEHERDDARRLARLLEEKLLDMDDRLRAAQRQIEIMVHQDIEAARAATDPNIGAENCDDPATCCRHRGCDRARSGGEQED